MLQTSEQQTTSLRKLLSAATAYKPALDAAMKSASTSCAACHKVYRD